MVATRPIFFFFGNHVVFMIYVFIYYFFIFIARGMRACVEEGEHKIDSLEVRGWRRACWMGRMCRARAFYHY